MKSTGLLFLFIVFYLVTSCVDDKLSFVPSHCISFSSDTIVFDTLFVGQSSSTKSFMVYNKNSKALMIDEIFIPSADKSKFRFNINGKVVDNGSGLNDMVIRARDSIYVFVEFYPNSTDSIGADIYALDSLCFSCNGTTKSVKLLGIGREAILHNNHYIISDYVMSNSKPNLVLGNLHVAENAKLTIPAGTELFMHHGANIVVDGDLVIDGTVSSPVVIRGDRYDCVEDVDNTPYQHLPNQWGGILLQNPLGQYIIKNARINGMTLGVCVVGSNSSKPILSIENSIIKNSGIYGIYALMADTKVSNSEISNCGNRCLSVVGGSAIVTHTTIANYFNFASRSTSSVYLSNTAYPIDGVVFENCIVFGQNQEEIELVFDSGNVFNVLFSNSLIKGVEKKCVPFYSNCIWARSRNFSSAVDTVFKSTTVSYVDGVYFDFHLDSLSLARGKATIDVANKFVFDLDGRNRLYDGHPDLGAYEFYSELE